MNIETQHLYHIYNQGNNRQKIFFSRENYILFLRKIKLYILPHADILAWCLMPNHFHLMVYVNHQTLTTHQMTGSHQMSSKSRTFSNSIAILLRSYTRAINNQEIRTGALFKPHTQANCLNESKGITPAFFNNAFGTSLNVRINEKEYPQVCWNYIHNNPLTAGLVSHPEDWEFSSYRDYFCERNGKLINKERARELGLYSFDDRTLLIP